MKLLKPIILKLKRHSVALIISLVNAIAVLLLCYFIDNLPYSFVGDATSGQHFEQIRQIINTGQEEIPSDLWLINVAYDRELVDIQDDFGFPKGNIDITDRSKLLKLLSQLRESDYRYIILDVSFAKDYHTSVDSALFDIITSMRNIVISKSDIFELADSAIADKARYSDFSTHISESNFVKCEFIRNGEPTMPYQAYQDIYGNSISSSAGLYFFNGRLANKSAVLRFTIKAWNRISSNSGSNDIGQLQYYNIGCDILDIDVDVARMAKDKIIVIGDYCENDMHDTYLGKMAGPIIIINAFYAMVNDNISIPYIEIIFLFILYFTISMVIIKDINVRTYIPGIKSAKSKTWNFILSFIGLSSVLTLISLVCYVFFGLDINILIPSLYFSIFGVLVKYYKTLAKS